MRDFIHSLKRRRAGLVVAGEQLDPSDSLACLQIARHLGWPLAADTLSGALSAPFRHCVLWCLMLSKEICGMERGTGKGVVSVDFRLYEIKWARSGDCCSWRL